VLKNSSIRNRIVGIVVAVVSVIVFAGATAAQDMGGIKGKVRTPSGNGIASATITARKNGSDIATATSDSSGSFVINGLESGRYNIVFDAKGYSSGVLYNIEVKKKKTIDLGDRLILSTDQGTLVLVKGSVFFKEGTSISGAKVELEKVAADGSVRRLGSAYTNVSGEFTFRQPEGAAKLRIRASYKGVEGTKEIEVDAAAIYRLAVTLDVSRSDK
jgi:hypothetical protein